MRSASTAAAAATAGARNFGLSRSLCRRSFATGGAITRRGRACGGGGGGGGGGGDMFFSVWSVVVVVACI